MNDNVKPVRYLQLSNWKTASGTTVYSINLVVDYEKRQWTRQQEIVRPLETCCEFQTAIKLLQEWGNLLKLPVRSS